MRGPPVYLRELTAEEASAVESLARSRTAAARRVERARIVWRATRGETPPTIAGTLGLSAETVRRHIRRFNAEGLAALEDHHRSGRPATYTRVRGKKGRIETLYTAPPAGSVVLCLDEMGPLSAKSYPARGTANWVAFLDEVEHWIPDEVKRVYAIADNLSSHHTTDVLLFLLAHPRWEMVFQPKSAAYLNLIEPWWKILRSLALAGQRFESWDEVTAAVEQATAYWNAHRHPFRWGHRRRHRPRRQPGIARP